MEELIRFLESIEDGRQAWKVEHKLAEIVIITLFATLANADDWVEIGAWAAHHEKLLRKYIPLANGAPSHDTIQRVMAMIKPEKFQELLKTWRKLLDKQDGRRIKQLLSLDGKTMRGSGNKNQDALHVVSAWSKEGGVCFGQRSSDSKGKELSMIKELLASLTIKGQIITIDAIGAQKEITKIVRAGKGDYLLAVKENQPSLCKAIGEYFEIPGILDEIKGRNGYYSEGERARGQSEKREYYQADDINWLTGDEKWDGLRSIGMVVSTIYLDDGTEKRHVRYFISSLKADAALFAYAARGHWGIESMHWHLDVTFREDKNRTLDKNAAENMNIVRKWALSILKTADLGKKYSLKKKRFVFGFNFEENLEVLMRA